MNDTLRLDSPLDMHLHLRQGAMLQTVAPLSSKSFAGAIIMPNLVPPLDSLAALLEYRQRIAELTAADLFEPYMTVFFRRYSRAELELLKPQICGVKLYPAGITTNSEAGVRSLDDHYDTIELLQELGIPLLIHGESDGFVMDREEEFLPLYIQLARRFPSLTIVMEHITTAAALRVLEEYPNLNATVTLHHLLITLDDVAGGLLNPHLFCKPIAKRPSDRQALVEAVLRAHPRICFGSDSAPHPVDKKECCGCAAGVFTAPVALPLLAELFDLNGGSAQALQAFVSDNARRIYGVTPPHKQIVLHRQPMVIPPSYADVVPLRAGGSIEWSFAE
jgi:dihydroorotase